VTQTALAVVGGIIGSSLLTIAAFVLIMRYRRSKRRRDQLQASRVGNISYPDLKGSSSNATGGGRIGGGYKADDAESVYSTDDNGYPVDIKAPVAVAVRGSVNKININGRGAPGVGYAVSYYGPQTKPQSTNSNNVMSGTTATSGGGGGGGFQLSDPPKGKFSLFPKSSSKDDLNSPQSGISTTMTESSDGRGTPQMRLQRTSKGLVPSLDAWIRAGTVSPFATLRKGASPTGKRS